MPENSILEADQAQEYYDNLSVFQKKRMQILFDKLSTEEQNKILNDNNISKNETRASYSDNANFYLGMYLFSLSQNHSSNPNSLLTIAPFTSNNSHHASSHSNQDGRAALFIILAAIITSVIVSTLYAIKKIWNATRNIVNGEKLAKSTFRLQSIFIFTALFALAGTLIEGLGPILGALIGAGIGSGVSAFGSKYFAKIAIAIASIFSSKEELDGTEISITNAKKYQITPDQRNNIEHRAIIANVKTSNTVINTLLNQFRNIKNASPLMGSFHGTEENDKKAVFNGYVSATINGDLLVDLDGNIYQFKDNKSILFIHNNERKLLNDALVESLPKLTTYKPSMV